MPSPSPIAVVRLSANTEMSVNRVSRRRTSSVPTTANTPTASGRSAATRLPNTMTSATAVNGAVRISDSWRSLRACSEIWCVSTASPVASVERSAVCTVNRCDSSPARLKRSFSPPDIAATISAWCASRLRSWATLP